MWSQKTKKGTVRYCERYVNPMTGKSHTVSVTLEKDSPRNRKLALNLLNDKIDERIGHLLAQKQEKALTLSDLVKLYLDYQSTSVSRSTYRRNVYACDALSRIIGANVLIKNLNAGYVRERLSSQGESPTTINERITRFKALIRWAYKNDYLTDISWLDKVEKLKDDRKKEKRLTKYLERDELSMLLSAMTVEHWHDLAELCALSGLRVGEAIALDLPDLNLSERLIGVTKTFDPVNEIVTSPKTASSNRDVYMQDDLYALCQSLSVKAKRQALACGYVPLHVFADANGQRRAYYAFEVYLRKKSMETLGRSITTHYFRHTHVALLAEQGIPLDVISRRLGHSDSKVTRDVYMHVTERIRERDYALLKKVSFF